jgi:arylsulfatase A-like enzyme
MPHSFLARYWSLTLALSGAGPLLLGLPLYRVGILLFAQTGTLRALGVFAFFSLALIAAATVLALGAVTARLDRPELARFWRMAFYGLALVNLAGVGLTMFFYSPSQAPRSWQIGAALALVVLAVSFWRHGEQEQRFLTRGLRGVGLASLIVPVLALPLVVQAAMRDRLPLATAPRLLDKPQVQAQRPRRIVLVTFDSLRARSTSLHTPALRNTPHLEALARESFWFTNFRSASDATKYSLPSLATGMPPHDIFPYVGNRQGLLRRGAAYDIAAHLKGAGYSAYYATMLVSPALWALEHHFDGGHFNHRFLHAGIFNTRDFLPVREAFEWTWHKVTQQRGAGSAEPHGSAAPHVLVATRQTLDQAREQLRAAKGPIYMRVHVAAPHAPYFAIPREDLGGELHPEKYPPVWVNTSKGPEYLRARERAYEAYVGFGDAELGRFIQGLKQDGLWEDTLFIATSDHGEEFVPNMDIHGNGLLTEDVTHVPLLIHLPGQKHGRRIDVPSGHIDLMPTILSCVFRDLPAGLKGAPLIPAPPKDRVAFSYGLYKRDLRGQHGTQHVAAYYRHYKYLFRYPDRRGFLYDLRQDPAATRDQAAGHPEVASHLREAVREAYGL